MPRPRGCGNCNFGGRNNNNGTEKYCMLFSCWHPIMHQCLHYIEYADMGDEQRQQEANKVLAEINRAEDIESEQKSEKSKKRREWLMIVVNAVISIITSVITACITSNIVAGK